MGQFPLTSQNLGVGKSYLQCHYTTPRKTRRAQDTQNSRERNSPGPPLVISSPPIHDITWHSFLAPPPVTSQEGGASETVYKVWLESVPWPCLYSTSPLASFPSFSQHSPVTFLAIIQGQGQLLTFAKPESGQALEGTQRGFGESPWP